MTTAQGRGVAPRNYVSDSARGWRLVARQTTNLFAWDVHRLMIIAGAKERSGIAESSADASPAFDVANAFRDDETMWGGRRDETGRFHIGLTSTKEAPIDRIVLVQGDEHWASSVEIEQLDDNGLWRTFASVDGLHPGTNELRWATEETATNDRPIVTRRVDDPFADRRILITIAAYRDPDVATTVAHALTQAAYPEHVRFAICHQFDDETVDALAPWSDDPRFSIDAVSHSDSRGCCWARARTFDLYDDEPYLLQIDAHTRFAARWDQRYIDMLESLDHQRSVITSYPANFTIDEHGDTDYNTDAGTRRLVIRELRQDLTTLQDTEIVSDAWRPGPSPTVAAGQIFTRGTFCVDVPYDPEIYFAGEEISMAARAYTSGYDLCFPTENLVWHLYDHPQPKHWEDHREHTELHESAASRLKTLFLGDASTLGRFGLGDERSLTEFERAAKLRFSSATSGAGHDALTIELQRSVIEPRDDYDAFVVILLDDQGREVGRQSVRDPDVLELRKAAISLRGLDTRGATSYLVVPTTYGSYVGEVELRQL